MKKLIVSSLFLFLFFPSLIPAPVVPVVEVPQEHYGPVFKWMCLAEITVQQEKILGSGTGLYKEEKITWVASPDLDRGEKLNLLFSISLDSSNLAEIKKKTHWGIYASSSDTFYKYSQPGALLGPYGEILEEGRDLQRMVCLFGRYLPWTLVRTQFAADAELVEGALKTIEKTKVFSDLKPETPVNIKSSEGPLLD